MVRTIILTILIVIGAAVGGYALWSTSQTDSEVVLESLDDTATTACASATGPGCEGCPSAMAADATAAAPTCGAETKTACASEMHTADADCEGCPSKATCAGAEACVGDADCACDGDPANCTPEMKAACGEKCESSAAAEVTPACGAAKSCGGGRCGIGGSSADAS